MKLKKHHCRPSRKGLPLQNGLDNIIHSTVLAPQKPYRVSHRLRKSIDRSLKQYSKMSQSMGVVLSQSDSEEMGRLGEEVKRWISRMPPNQRVLGEDYKEFNRLTE